MLSDFRWGSFSIKKLCIEVLKNFWMIIAVMIITFLGTDLLDRAVYTPMYTSESIVAVYPFNTLYSLDSSTDTWDAVVSVTSVFNSDMFRVGLEDQTGQLGGRSFSAEQITNTNMLKLRAESPDPADAFKTIRAAINYYEEFSSSLPEQSTLEILLQPEISFKVSDKSPLHKYKVLLTLFMGFAVGALLVLLYVARPTYKTVGAFKRTYKDVRCFVLSPMTKEHKRTVQKDRSRKKKSREQDIRTTVVELRQLLRHYGKKSILLTSSDPEDGKAELAVSLAKEFADQGYKVVLIDADFRPLSLESFFRNIENSTGSSLLDILKEKCTAEEAGVSFSEERIQVISAGDESTEDDFSFTAEDVIFVLNALTSLYDVILVNGKIWNSATDVCVWSESVGATLVVCGQDKADFRTIDVMIEEIGNGNSVFAGCVLNGFV